MKKSLMMTGLLLISSGTTAAQTAEDFVDAITSGQVIFSARLRYETVQQDNLLKNAQATTLRTTLGYKTDLFHGWGGIVEIEDITNIFDNDYEEYPQETMKTHSVIADPNGTEINQAYMSYQGLNIELRLGRQEITYRDAPSHRFIGNVLWRQNHQSFDAFSLVSSPFNDIKLSYAFVDRVNTIFGDDLTEGTIRDGDIDMNNHLFNIQHTGFPIGRIEGYGYLLNYQDDTSLSSRTLGLRLSGSRGISGDWEILYSLEHARQDGYQGGRMDEQEYYLAELGAKYKKWQVKLSYELLGGDGIDSFSTPLGTNHAFQGWADIFLSTPKQGLEDLYFTVSSIMFGVKSILVYHDFETDQSNFDAGEEWDLLIEKKFMDRYTLGLKFSSYKADTEYSAATDTDKLWLYGMFNF